MRFFIIVITIAFAAGCSDQKVKPSINTKIKIEELPAQESWNTKVIFTDSGKTQAILYTGHLRMFTGARETLLDSSVKVEFFNDSQKVATILTSKRGRVDDISKNLFAIDSVVAVSDSGVTLMTSELMWRNEDRKIVTSKFVTILTKVEKIEGYGFESDQSLNNYVIYNPTYVTRRDTL
ncbi:MAG: LPS export ABC transporter periplasmic protein LptC [Ignavibacteriaceae bacterium]|nr:LPS export ABC transporter periplasmic protein LptC [Ignavibacteriaceae bacterium]